MSNRRFQVREFSRLSALYGHAVDESPTSELKQPPTEDTKTKNTVALVQLSPHQEVNQPPAVSPGLIEENDSVAFPSCQEEERNGMDQIRNIGTRGTGLQHLPRFRLADRPERGDTPLQLRAESYFPGMLRPVSKLREPRQIHQ